MLTTETRTQLQDQWDEIARDPALQDLPYKVETNARGQLILSPHKRYHARQQYVIQKHLEAVADGGMAIVELPVLTSEGVRVPDVSWVTPDRLRDMDKTGDPSPLAPEICIEVMSGANSDAEMIEKRDLYIEAGAEEVWIVKVNGTVQVHDDSGPIERSHLAPAFPEQVDV